MKELSLADALTQLGIQKSNPGVSTGRQWLSSKGPAIVSVSPVDGKKIGSVKSTDEASFRKVVAVAEKAFVEWRAVPAPKRGEVVRQIGEALRKKKTALGMLVSYEMGKSLQEGLGGAGDDRHL